MLILLFWKNGGAVFSRAAAYHVTINACEGVMFGQR